LWRFRVIPDIFGSCKCYGGCLPFACDLLGLSSHGRLISSQFHPLLAILKV
jgi:hypothetical protein